MAWIETHQSLRNHRKTLFASEKLSMDKHKLIGHLLCLWWWALDNADIDGNLPPGTSAKTIANAAEIPVRNADKFLKTLVEVCFVEENGGRLCLHDWYEYAGKLNLKRKANRDRMREARYNAQKVYVQSTDDARVEATVPTLPTIPIITKQTLIDSDIANQKILANDRDKIHKKFQHHDLNRQYDPNRFKLPDDFIMPGTSIDTAIEIAEGRKGATRTNFKLICKELDRRGIKYKKSEYNPDIQ